MISPLAYAILSDRGGKMRLKGLNASQKVLALLYSRDLPCESEQKFSHQTGTCSSRSDGETQEEIETSRKGLQQTLEQGTSHKGVGMGRDRVRGSVASHL